MALPRVDHLLLMIINVTDMYSDYDNDGISYNSLGFGERV